MTRKPTVRLHAMRAFFALALVSAATIAAQQWRAAEDTSGVLTLTIIDPNSRQTTPARIELVDAEKKGYIPEDAIPTGGD